MPTTTRRKLPLRLLLLSLALLTTASLARAADPAPVPFIRASVVSIDAVNQLISDFNIPLPFNIQSILETTFPFIGAGGIDSSKPLGVIFLAGENLPSASMALFAFPITPGKVSLDDLKNIGATPVEGSSDILTLNGSLAFKRTTDFLFMYTGAPDLIKDAQNTLFASDYQSPATLAYVEINAAAARTAAPRLTASFFDSLKNTGNPDPNPLSDRTRRATQDFLANALAKIDLLTLALSADKTNFKLVTTISPTFTTGTREFPKPLFPSTAIFTAHVVYPDAAAANWLPKLIGNLKDDELPVPGAKLSPEQITSERQTFADLLQLLAAPDAQSFSAENRAGKLVFVIVNQYDHDLNLTAQFRKDCEQMEALAKITGNSDAPLVFQDLTTSDGSSGFRIDNPFPKKDDSPSAFFITQKGRTVTFTISCEQNPVPSLIDLSPSDKISDLLSAHVDFSAVLAAAQNDASWKYTPPEIQQKLATFLTGKSLDFIASTDPATNSLHLTLTCPRDVVRAGMLIVTALMAPAPPAPIIPSPPPPPQ